MRSFARLFERLDETTKTNEKIAAIRDYLQDADDADAAWAVWLLSGRRLKRVVRSGDLRRWIGERLDLPEWLVEDAYAAVGDSAETVALLLDTHGALKTSEAETASASIPDLASLITEHLEPLKGREEADQRQRIEELWLRCSGDGPRNVFVLNKILTGGLRVGVSRGLVVRALAAHADLDAPTLEHRLIGNARPSAEWYRSLIDPETTDVDDERPYPFFLASPLPEDTDADGEPLGAAVLGEAAEWRAEWKWDGIRGQIVRRGEGRAIWSRGEELVTERFPELTALLDSLPDGTVLDGELLARKDGEPLPFSQLQRRLNRKTVPKTLLKEAPVSFVAYDLLELGHEDLRDQGFDQRRAELERLVASVRANLPDDSLVISPLIEFDSWEQLRQLRERSREERAEGLMLKRGASPYLTGRKRGDWWKWKVDPFTVDTVLVYAQAGHGRRATIHSDFTLAVRDGDAFVPVAKAYSGLDDKELTKVDRWIRSNTTERFGPVRAVPAEQVFEIAFEGIQASPRHKSGIALRFPRIARWRQDKPVEEIDTLDSLKELLAGLDG